MCALFKITQRNQWLDNNLNNTATVTRNGTVHKIFLKKLNWHLLLSLWGHQNWDQDVRTVLKSAFSYMLDIPCFCECKLQKHMDLINKSTKPQKCLKSALLLILLINLSNNMVLSSRNTANSNQCWEPCCHMPICLLL